MKLNKAKKAKLIKIIIAIVLMFAVGAGLFFAVKAAGGFDKLQELIAHSGKWAVILFFVIRIVFSIILICAPAVGITFDAICITLWGSGTWETYLICIGSVFATSIVIDLIGRFGGYKLIIKILGEEDYLYAQKLVKEKGIVYVPFMYLLPIFPDNAICMLTGASKINFGVHALIMFIFRGIGISFTVFGISLIPDGVRQFTSTNLWDYVEVVTIIAFWIMFIFKVAKFIDKRYSKILLRKLNKKKALEEKKTVSAETTNNEEIK